MGVFVFDVSLGRTTEFYSRVDSNDPTNSALIMVILSATGLESDNVLRTHATLSALLAAANDEVTNTNYARKVLTDAELAAYTVDIVNHRIRLPLPTQTFTSIVAGNSWAKALICYDSDTTAGTDANIIPMTAHDTFISGVAIVPNGNNILIAAPNDFMVSRQS